MREPFWVLCDWISIPDGKKVREHEEIPVASRSRTWTGVAGIPLAANRTAGDIGAVEIVSICGPEPRKIRSSIRSRR